MEKKSNEKGNKDETEKTKRKKSKKKKLTLAEQLNQMKKT